MGIDGTVYHPLEVPQLIDEGFETILDTAAAIADPFEQAFFALVHLAYLQGFEDVNKRVSRLAANIPLIRGNLCPLSFVDVPKRAYIDGMSGVYELNRVELLRDMFVWASQRSSARYSAARQSLGEPDPFRLRYRVLVAELVREHRALPAAAGRIPCVAARLALTGIRASRASPVQSGRQAPSGHHAPSRSASSPASTASS